MSERPEKTKQCENSTVTLSLQRPLFMKLELELRGGWVVRGGRSKHTPTLIVMCAAYSNSLVKTNTNESFGEVADGDALESANAQHSLIILTAVQAVVNIVEALSSGEETKQQAGN